MRENTCCVLILRYSESAHEDLLALEAENRPFVSVARLFAKRCGLPSVWSASTEDNNQYMKDAIMDSNEVRYVDDTGDALIVRMKESLNVTFWLSRIAQWGVPLSFRLYSELDYRCQELFEKLVSVSRLQPSELVLGADIDIAVNGEFRFAVERGSIKVRDLLMYCPESRWIPPYSYPAMIKSACTTLQRLAVLSLYHVTTTDDRIFKTSRVFCIRRISPHYPEGVVGLGLHAVSILLLRIGTKLPVDLLRYLHSFLE